MSPDRSSERTSFAAWLQADDQPVYWITGQAGAGKSILMKFLVDDQRKNEHLVLWRGNRRLYVAWFFFSRSGTFLEKSLEGLVRSLLHQILTQAPELIPVSLPDRDSKGQPFRKQLYGDNTCNWSREELIDALGVCIRKATRTYMSKVILFIDGLDEMEGHLEMLKSFLMILQGPGVKLCVASRRLPVFENALGQSSQLRVCESTYRDIEEFVWSTLKTNDVFDRNDPLSTDLVREICQNANGNFLWACLVTQAILAGMDDGSTLNDLRYRVANFSVRLEDVFKTIVQRGEIGKEPQTEAVLGLRDDRPSISDAGLTNLRRQTESIEETTEARGDLTNEDDWDTKSVSTLGPESVFSVTSVTSSASTAQTLVQSMSTSEELAEMLLQDDAIQVLCKQAVKNTGIGPERFANNFRRLLVIFGDDLLREVHTPLERLTAKFMKSESRHMASIIRRRFDPEYAEMMSRLSDVMVSTQMSAEERRRQVEELLQKQEFQGTTSAVPDDESADEDDPVEPEQQEELPSFHAIQMFVRDSAAFVKFKSDLHTFVLPKTSETVMLLEKEPDTLPEAPIGTLSNVQPDLVSELQSEPASNLASMLKRLWIAAQRASRPMVRSGYYRLEWTCVSCIPTAVIDV